LATLIPCPQVTMQASRRILTNSFLGVILLIIKFLIIKFRVGRDLHPCSG